MPRRCSILVVTLTLATAASSSAQGFLGSSADCLNSQAPTLPLPPRCSGWPVAQRVKTGRITIEFQYVAPIQSRICLWTRMVPDDTWNLVSVDQSANCEPKAAAAWRKDISVIGDLLPRPEYQTCIVSLGQDFQLPLISEADIMSGDVAETAITSVQFTPASDAPATLPLPAFVPNRIRLEFFRPPAPLPVHVPALELGPPLEFDKYNRLMQWMDVGIPSDRRQW